MMILELFYCEQCNCLISPKQIEAQQIKETASGKICASCIKTKLPQKGNTSKQLTPVERPSGKRLRTRTPIVDTPPKRKARDSSRTLTPIAAPKSRSEKKISVQSTAHDARNPAPPEIKKKNLTLPLIVAASALIVVGITLFAFSDSDMNQSSIEAKQTPDDNDKLKSSLLTKGSNPEDSSPPQTKDEDLDKATQAQNAEDEAAIAREKLESALPNLEKEKKIEHIKTFLSQHGNTIQAARIKVLLTDLETKPKPQPPAPKPQPKLPAKPPAVKKEPPKAAPPKPAPVVINKKAIENTRQKSLRDFAANVQENNLQAALDQTKKLLEEYNKEKDPAYDQIKATLEAANKFALSLIERDKIFRETLENSEGKKVALGSGKNRRRGIVKEVNDEGVKVDTQIIINGKPHGSVEHTIHWAHISDADKKRYTKEWQAPAKILLIHRLLIDLNKKKPNVAEIENKLEPAKDHPLADIVRRKIALIRKGATEIAAEETWRTIQSQYNSNLKVADAEKLMKQILKFETSFRQSEFFKKMSANIDKTKMSVHSATLINLVKDGNFERGLDAWKVHKTSGSSLNVIPLASKDDPTKGSMVAELVAVPNRRGRTWIEQDITLEPSVLHQISYRVNVQELSEPNGVVALEINGKKLRERLQIKVGAISEKWLDSKKYFLPQNDQAKLFLQTHGLGKNMRCYIDDIKVTKAGIIRKIPKAAKEFNGHHYHFFKEKVSWELASKVCEAQGGHLATITSAEEFNFLKGMAAGRQGSWIGLSAKIEAGKPQHGNWVWETGEKFDFKKWVKGEPNNHKDSEHWVTMNQQGWYDNAWAAGFICEWDPISDTSIQPENK